MSVSRGVIGAAVAGTVVATALIAGYLTLGLGFAVCGGDGGEPYSADASTAGRFCRGPLAPAYFVGQVVLPILLVLGLGLLATARRRWRELGLGVGAAAVTLVAMYAVVSSLPQECSEAQFEDARRAGHPERCLT